MKSQVARTIIRKQPEGTYLAPEKPKEPKPRAEWKSLPEELAQSSVYICRWYFKGGEREFPYQNNLQYVDRYFPYAQGGALLMDFPQDDDELKLCEKKAPIIRKNGYRYLIVEKSMDINAVRERLSKL